MQRGIFCTFSVNFKNIRMSTEIWKSCAEALQALQEFKRDEIAGCCGSKYKPHPAFRSKQSRFHYNIWSYETLKICIIDYLPDLAFFLLLVSFCKLCQYFGVKINWYIKDHLKQNLVMLTASKKSKLLYFAIFSCSLILQSSGKGRVV